MNSETFCIICSYRLVCFKIYMYICIYVTQGRLVMLLFLCRSVTQLFVLKGKKLLKMSREKGWENI